MAVYGVWINNLDLRLPRIALFAIKDIEKGEELTFDYMMTGIYHLTLFNLWIITNFLLLFHLRTLGTVKKFFHQVQYSSILEKMTQM